MPIKQYISHAHTFCLEKPSDLPFGFHRALDQDVVDDNRDMFMYGCNPHWA